MEQPISWDSKEENQSDLLKRKLESAISFMGFSVPFLVMSPLFFIFSTRKEWHKHGYTLNRVWARIFFWVSGLKVEREYKSHLHKEKNYIYAPNHTSFIDIPTMGLHHQGVTFVGKSSMAKIPLFGYMYKKLHITVNRESIKSSYNTLIQSKEAVDSGKSLVMFPEGGIRTQNPPEMTRFKDGPFRVAIEKQIPVVPVSIPYNWIVLPDDGKFLLNKRAVDKLKVIFHEPISTKGMTLDDLDELKKKTYRIIQEELRKHNEKLMGNGD